MSLATGAALLAGLILVDRLAPSVGAGGGSGSKTPLPPGERTDDPFGDIGNVRIPVINASPEQIIATGVGGASMAVDSGITGGGGGLYGDAVEAFGEGINAINPFNWF